MQAALCRGRGIYSRQELSGSSRPTIWTVPYPDFWWVQEVWEGCPGFREAGAAWEVLACAWDPLGDATSCLLGVTGVPASLLFSFFLFSFYIKQGKWGECRPHSLPLANRSR